MIKKVLTAIGNSTLNKKIKKLDDYQILTKDIPNDEELIEWLEREKNVDILFLYQDIIKNYKENEFIKIIKKLQKNIMIYFFENEKNKSKLKENNNLKIYKNSEINWEGFKKNLEKISPENMEKNNSKIITVSGTNGVREKYIFHISCKKCGKQKNIIN